MNLKNFFYNNNSLTNFTLKKTLNQALYNKFLLRNTLVNEKLVHVLDNESSFSNISQKVLDSNLLKKIPLKSGSALNFKHYVYKNTNNNALIFKSVLPSYSKTTSSAADSFSKILTSLKLNNEMNITPGLLVLKPVKGGFNCYSSGIIGFLPRSHGIFFLVVSLLSIVADANNERKFENLKYLSTKTSFSRKMFSLRLKAGAGKVTVYSESKLKTFSLSTKRKKRHFLRDCNFVFLSLKVDKNIKLT